MRIDYCSMKRETVETTIQQKNCNKFFYEYILYPNDGDDDCCGQHKKPNAELFSDVGYFGNW